MKDTQHSFTEDRIKVHKMANKLADEDPQMKEFEEKFKICLGKTDTEGMDYFMGRAQTRFNEILDKALKENILSLHKL